MSHSMPESRSVTLSVRLYRAMLRGYPAAFRAEYAEPMAQLFRDNCRRAHRQEGPAGVLSLWAHTLPDYARTTLEEHAEGGVRMTRSTFVRLSGWALPIGAISLVLGFLANNRPEYNPYNLASTSVDRLANAADIFLVVFGFLLCSFGMVGLLVRYGQTAGQWARFGLGAGAISALVAATGAIVGEVTPDSAAAWPMFFFGMTFMFVGLLIFGVACIRRKPLPRWNTLPLLTAIWLPTAVLIGAVYGTVTGDLPEASSVNGMLLALASFGGLALLGYVLLTDDRALETGVSVL